MGRSRIRTGGTLTTVYLDKRLHEILKVSAKAQGVSVNTLIARELALKYLEN
jgi:predicted HicB family RNase H-like nuclease